MVEDISLRPIQHLEAGATIVAVAEAMMVAVVVGTIVAVAMKRRSSNVVKGTTTKPYAKSVARVIMKLLIAGIAMMSPFRVKTTR
jgi:hypothetical protein